MIEKIIAFFSERHLLTNFITVLILVGGVFYWFNTNKEELPDIELDFVRISTSYSGATPSEIEHFVTKPLEDTIRGLEGIYRLTSTSSTGSSSIFVELDPDISDKDSVINDIKTQILEVNLPDDVRDPPRVRQFKTSQKAILDVAIVNTNVHLLDKKTRKELQQYVLTLENQLLSLHEVSSINRSGYLQEELQINLKPEKLSEYNLPISTVIDKIKAYNIRQPVGSLEDKNESKITLSSPLYTVQDLKKVIIQGSFEGQQIYLSEIAEITNSFPKKKEIIKVNGHEAVILNVVKSSSTGILKAMAKVRHVVDLYKSSFLASSSYEIYTLDDESIDVRNRLSIIGWNGLIGFILIISTLFIFLDFRSGIWVAMGIPFTFCFTMIIISFLGYTINNITLAAVIIVMGMIVDDAIVVAENISRLRTRGLPDSQAIVSGTSAMFLPILASIVTTCIAFLPLLSIGGRFSKMNKFIPVIVIIMLGGSLIESLVILPGHLRLKFSRTLKIVFTLGLYLLIENKGKEQSKKSKVKGTIPNTHWFFKIENAYGNLLAKVLKYNYVILFIFILLAIISTLLFKKMKYVMFPREEATSIRLNAEAREGTPKLETAELSIGLEKILNKYLGKEVTGYRTEVARSRWGGASAENSLMMSIELVSKEDRNKSLNQLTSEWEFAMTNLGTFPNIRFMKNRFGHSSGSPIEIVVADNNDVSRQAIINELFLVMSADNSLINAEPELIQIYPEYKISIKREMLSILNINPAKIGSTLRTILDGSVLYQIPRGDEDIDLTISVTSRYKNNISDLFNVPIENNSRYLVPLRNIVNITKEISPSSINRENFKRVSKIYADLNDKSKKVIVKRPTDNSKSSAMGHPPANANKKNIVKQAAQKDSGMGKIEPFIKKTPLEIAAYYENKIFPVLLKKYPSAIIYFDGEVKETRESKNEFTYALLLVVVLIYFILALLFNSLGKPFIILLSIPFGMIGVILAYYAHGMEIYGFYSIIGVLGLSGVVVNDAIVMLNTLESEFNKKGIFNPDIREIADISKTRLRAVILTTLTTVAGLFPTAYGVAGYDSMLSEMMLAMGWGLIFGTCVTLLLVPILYYLTLKIKYYMFSGQASGI